MGFRRGFHGYSAYGIFHYRGILVVWVTYDKDWNVLTKLILGRGGTQQFSGEGSITWTGTRTLIMPGDYRIHMLDVTVLGSAPIGKYKAVVTVWGEQKPIKAKVTITPAVLNVKSKGQWVTAYISLPEPYKEEDIDIGSVKLLYKGDFVQAEWGKATKHFLLVKFSGDQVIKMLKSETGRVQLAVTGLVNGIEFSGTDTIIVIEPRR